MNTAQECLDLLIPNIVTRAPGLVNITSPLSVGKVVSLRATINDIDGHRVVVLEQVRDRSADVPRAVRLRNPEAYAPAAEVAWAFGFPMGSMDQLHVSCYIHKNLGIDWTQPITAANEADQADARSKLFLYLRNLIRQDFAEG
jgi:hypothetical protein